MQSNFDRAFEFILQFEQWHVDTAGDSGGRTMWGVSSTYHREFVDAHWDDDQDTSKMLAMDIYRSEYWKPYGCDTLPSGLDLMTFDAAVNQGVEAATESCRQSSIAMIAAMRLIRYARAQDGYDHQPEKPQFCKGWMRRLAACIKTATAWQGE